MFTLLQQSTKNILHRVSPAVWTSMIHINDVAWLACDCDYGTSRKSHPASRKSGRRSEAA
jgi:hypothetical protein